MKLTKFRTIRIDLLIFLFALLLPGQAIVQPVNAAFVDENLTTNSADEAIQSFRSDGTIINASFDITPNNSGASAAKQNVEGFQNALNLAESAGITHVKVEEGTYYVDTSHSYDGNSSAADNSIFIPSNITLDLSDTAFVQIANSATGYAIFGVKNSEKVTIQNGTQIASAS